MSQPEPPDIDLGPSNYRVERNGRWHLPDDPKLHMWMFFIALGVLGYIFWYRAELTSEILFGVSAMFAFVAGIMLANWLKNVY